MKKDFLLRLLMALMVVSLWSCGDDDNIVTPPTPDPKSRQDLEYENKLMGTSWKVTKHYFKIDDGEINYSNNIWPGTITYGYNHIWYLVNARLGNNYNVNADGTWEVEDGQVKIALKHFSNMGSTSSLTSAIIQIGNAFGGQGKIRELTNTKLILGFDFDSGGWSDYEYEKVNYKEGTILSDDSNDNGGGNGGSGGEPPYVTSFDFTATKTSITVKFMCSERPTSATVKYGTSSPSSTASSSISGKQVTAKVTGLKAGTKYYFKCTVKNSNGSSTSDTYSAITEY